MTSKISLIFVLFTIHLAYGYVSLSDFFPYGLSNGDTDMVRSDDNSSFISITPNFTFFGYKQLWVNVNGAITFPTSVSTFTPSCSSLNGTYSIAALFWADVDITMSGHIYYRQSTESELLSKANNEITNAFPYLTNIDINWLFIATWHNVTYYPDNLPDPYYRKRNTFQAILAISGAQSFIIFYYNNITWTTGDASGGNNGLGGTPAFAGVDDGKGNRYEINGSCNNSIIDIANTSNVGIPGVWVFSGFTIQPIPTPTQRDISTSTNVSSIYSTTSKLPINLSSTTIQTTGGVTPSPICQTGWIDGWQHGFNKCIKVVDQNSPWNRSEQFCELYKNGYLVSISSAIESAFIIDIMSEIIGSTGWWVGGNNFLNHGNWTGSWTGNWTWSDGSPFDYTILEKATNNQNCTSGCCLKQTFQQWQIMPCFNETLPFVCEILEHPRLSSNPLPPTTTTPIPKTNSISTTTINPATSTKNPFTTETSNHASSSNGLKTYQIFLIIIGAIILILIICSFILCAYFRKNIGLLRRILNQENITHHKFSNTSSDSSISKSDSSTDSNISESLKSNVNEKNKSLFLRFTSLTNSEDTVKTQNSIYRLELDSNINVEGPTQVISDELIKLMEDESVNHLTFQNNDKTYAFYIEDMECLGLLEATARHQVKKYLHKPSKTKLAIKFLQIPQNRYGGTILYGRSQMIVREIQNMRLLSESPNIVDFYGLCFLEGQALLCMELMNLSLRDFYEIVHNKKKVEFPEKLVGYVFVKVVDALNFCKYKGVIHRDIKPSNILVNYSGEIKLCDFGESRILDNSLASSHVGTIAYWPPERFNYAHTKYDVRADVWSLGITLMEIILGRLPYLHHNSFDKDEGHHVDYGFVIQQYIVKTSFVEVIERYIKPKYSPVLCEILELCTRKLEERPRLEYLENIQFYEQSTPIEKNEIANILRNIS